MRRLCWASLLNHVNYTSRCCCRWCSSVNLLLQLRLLERCHGAVHRRLYLVVEAGSAATLRLLLLLLKHLLLSLCRLLDVLLLLCCLLLLHCLLVLP